MLLHFQGRITNPLSRMYQLGARMGYYFGALDSEYRYYTSRNQQWLFWE